MFASKLIARQALPRKAEQTDEEKKAREVLEDYATKYGKLQLDFETLEDYVASGFGGPEEEQRQREIEVEMQTIEDSISALGIEQDVVDEVLQTAYDLVSYEQTYHAGIPSPYALID
jgi:hypothetical protein